MKPFASFYQYYLENHQTTGNRIFHFLGIFFTIWVLIYIAISGKERFFWYLPLTLVLVPVLGHILFERKAFTELKNPLYSLASDVVLFFELLSGKEKFRTDHKDIIR